MGKTEAFQINEVVMQGTVMAGIMCAKLIDTAKEIVETGGVQYGEIKIPSQMFQDDIFQTSVNDRISVKTAAANEFFQNANRMKFNMQKSQMMMVHKKKLPKLLGIRINNQEMASCSLYKYLGDNINCKNNLDVNLEKREKQTHLDTTELIAISKEMNIPEKDIQVKLKLMEVVIIPKIYYNSETWTNMRKSDINNIDMITVRCLNRLLKLPESTPGYGLYAETGIIPAEQQITKKKLIFLHRILLNRCMMNRKILDLPKCWSEEIKFIKQQYSLAKYSDEEKGSLSKYSWKKTVNKAKLQTELESMRKEKSKIANIETFEKKEYLTKLKSEDARVAIKSRLMMLNLATNYKSGSHMTCCRKYSHLTNDFYTDDLFSSETVNIHEATIAIKECMQIRAQLLANHRASRNWRRETRNKKERNNSTFGCAVLLLIIPHHGVYTMVT